MLKCYYTHCTKSEMRGKKNEKKTPTINYILNLPKLIFVECQNRCVEKMHKFFVSQFHIIRWCRSRKVNLISHIVWHVYAQSKMWLQCILSFSLHFSPSLSLYHDPSSVFFQTFLLKFSTILNVQIFVLWLQHLQYGVCGVCAIA